ncbi:MAG: cadherin repeat domain-containing protein [Cyanobacteria bacterium J06649_11]
MSPNQAGVIRLKSSMDYETSPKEYTLKVRLSDVGDPPRTNPDEMTIKVTLININDNIPVFDTLTPSEVNITESIAPGTSILDANASDADQDTLVYSLEGQESAPFMVDPQTGTIRTNASNFNYNSQRKFCFLVKATDGKFVAYLNIIVYVTDINNNAPVITNQDTEISVPENLEVGTILKVITYEDKDQDVAGDVDISITSETANADMFRIQNKNQLVLTKELDYETRQSYTVNIRATDKGVPARIR